MHGAALLALGPSCTAIFKQLFGGYRLLRVLRQFRDHLGVSSQSSQIRLRQTTLIAPSLHCGGSIPDAICDRSKPNTFNRACDRAHLSVSIHQLCKVARDQKCKRGGSDLEGAKRHPDNVLGSFRRGQQRCRPPLRAFRYRARTRRLAQCCAEMARWRKLSIAQKHDYPGEKPGCKPRVAMARWWT